MVFLGGSVARAATSPGLGLASTFGILSSTYTNSGATVINGDLGYTTGTTPTVNGIVHVADGTYSSAGSAQGSALTALNNQPCTFSFAAGAIDLATDTTHGTIGVYTPGVYCITGAASIGGGSTITLTGSGTYIFRMTGALNTSDGSIVASAGASACEVFWTPGAATTLGANSTFWGTDIDAAGITIGSTMAWNGRALAYGGTVSSDVDTITVPTCTAPNPTLTVVKTVINNSGGTKVVSDFPLFVGTTAVTSGTVTSFAPGAYTLSESNIAGYDASQWGGDCSTTGTITLASGDIKLCTITNDDVAPIVAVTSSGGGSATIIPRVPPLISITKVPSPLALPSGPGAVTYTYKVANIGTVAMRDIKVTDDKCAAVALISGDTNSNNWLDTNEVWTYTCKTTVSQTTTNTATVIGYDAGGLSVVDVANATVVVGSPLPAPFIHVVKKPVPLVLPLGGGAVTYTYTVTNPGVVALSNVSLTDDKCSAISNPKGDTNSNGLLDTNETWIYTCRMDIVNATVNTAKAVGSANGLTATDYALATVNVTGAAKAATTTPAVKPVVPKLPNTGIGPNDTGTPWSLIALSGIIISLVLLYVIRQKKIA
jgi:hypothetical protein